MTGIKFLSLMSFISGCCCTPCCGDFSDKFILRKNLYFYVTLFHISGLTVSLLCLRSGILCIDITCTCQTLRIDVNLCRLVGTSGSCPVLPLAQRRVNWRLLMVQSSQKWSSAINYCLNVSGKIENCCIWGNFLLFLCLLHCKLYVLFF